MVKARAVDVLDDDDSDGGGMRARSVREEVEKDEDMAEEFGVRRWCCS